MNYNINKMDVHSGNMLNDIETVVMNFINKEKKFNKKKKKEKKINFQYKKSYDLVKFEKKMKNFEKN